MTRVVPHFVIVIFGLLFGYFVYKSFFYPPPVVHPLTWENASWITTPVESPVGIFRKEIYIADDIRSGWVKIAAPDTYNLTINGKSFGENVFYSSNVSGVHDITRSLTLGKNVIAVSVRRLSYPGRSKVVVYGEYTDVKGATTPFFSDSSWKVLNREDYQGGISWASPLYDEVSWPAAVMVGKPEPGEIYPVSLPPKAVTAAREAKWIRHPDLFVKQANFRKDFFLTDRTLDGWLRIVATVDYNLVVNGVCVATTGASDTIHVYDIAELLGTGDNSIEVVLRNPLNNNITHALYMDGELRGESYALPVKTGSDWKAYLPQADSRYEAPFVIGDYISYRYDKRPMVVTGLSLPFHYEVRRCTTIVGIIASGVFFAYMLILCISRAMPGFSGEQTGNRFPRASIALSVPVLFLLFLFVLQFDVRTDLRSLYSPVVVYGIFVLTVVSQAVFAACFHFSKVDEDRENPPGNGAKNSAVVKRWAVASAVILLVAAGAWIRLDNLGFVSLNGDEIGTVNFAFGILDKGYPYISIGGIDKPATTYELLPYPVAAAIGLFGLSETTVRLPSALFGISVIVVIFYMGRKFSNTATGLLAAAIYAFMPLEINLAQNARYMVSEQFYALLCCYFYYKAIEKKEIDKRSIFIAVIFFVLCYLTWEGSGYLLPSLLAGTFFVKGRDFSWMKNWHLWLASVGATLIVLIQFDYRTYWSVPFMILGSGLSDATFKLMFLTQAYNPWYYVEYFLWSQSHIFLSALVLAGLPIILRKKELGFLFLIVLSVIFLLSNTFSLYATRYVYYIQPILIILGSAVLIRFSGMALDILRDHHSVILKGIRYSVPLLLSLILFLTTNDYVLKPFRLSFNPGPALNPAAMNLRGVLEERRGLYPVDFRGANKFVKDNLSDGDIVVTVYTHPTKFYAGQADYFEETIIDTQIVYLDDQDYQRMVNKTVDIPAITDLPTFQRILFSHDRVWFVATSFELFNYLNDKIFMDYFSSTMKPMYETYRSRVYLWENGRRV